MLSILVDFERFVTIGLATQITTSLVLLFLIVLSIIRCIIFLDWRNLLSCGKDRNNEKLPIQSRGGIYSCLTLFLVLCRLCN